MNLIPRPRKHGSDPLLSSRVKASSPPFRAKLNPISPEKDKTLPSNSHAPQLNKHFHIQVDSKKNLDTFDKINRVRYPKTNKNDSRLINRGDLHQKLPKISKKMMTRYNLMNDVNLPYQDNDMRIYDPTLNYWESEKDLQKYEYFNSHQRNANGVIDASRGVDAVADPKFVSARLHDTQDAYGGYDHNYPVDRKYRVHVPEVLRPRVDYEVPYVRTMRPFYYNDPGVQLVAYPSRNHRYWDGPRKTKAKANPTRRKTETKSRKRRRKSKLRSKSRKRDKKSSKKKPKRSKTK